MFAEEAGHVQGKSPDEYTLAEGHSQPGELWEDSGAKRGQHYPRGRYELLDNDLRSLCKRGAVTPAFPDAREGALKMEMYGYEYKPPLPVF